MNKSGQFRKKVSFAMVSNNALRDQELSLKAKGLYSLIQSYITIPDFILYKNFLRKQCLEGDSAFNTAWKELKEQGYLIQYKLQDKVTKQFYYEYELLDIKNIEYANEIHMQQNCKNKIESSSSALSEKDKEVKIIKEKSHTYKNNLMASTPNGNMGVYNNTDLNNTDLNNTKDSSSTKKEEELLERVMQFCQETGYKLKKDEARILLSIHSFSKLIKALETATSTETFTSNSIKNYKAYLVSVINDLDRVKNITYNVNSDKTKTNDLKCNNFTQRDYDYNSLEQQLLGW